MIYTITYKNGDGGRKESFTVEAEDELEAISILGKYRGKQVTRKIQNIECLLSA